MPSSRQCLVRLPNNVLAFKNVPTLAAAAAVTVYYTVCSANSANPRITFYRLPLPEDSFSIINFVIEIAPEKSALHNGHLGGHLPLAAPFGGSNSTKLRNRQKCIFSFRQQLLMPRFFSLIKFRCRLCITPTSSIKRANSFLIV